MIKTKHYFICKGSKNGESNCGIIFYNEDDNICPNCGSKNTQKVKLDVKILKLK